MRFCLTVILALCVVATPSRKVQARGAAAQAEIVLMDVDGRQVNPFAERPGAANVFVFVSVECPISNRYAPEVIRLHEAFGDRASFWLVYPNPTETAEAIRAHLTAFRYPMRALRDPGHELVRHAGATVTPETAVYDRNGRLTYRGRIDDRYVSIGVERPAATRRDLEHAISATLADTPVTEAATTQAVGCIIADFVR